MAIASQNLPLSASPKATVHGLMQIEVRTPDVRGLLYPNSEILTHGAQRCAGMIAL